MLDIFKKYDFAFVEQILRLDQKLKEVFCLASIERQKYLVTMFDRRYNTKILIFFEGVLNEGYKIVLQNNINVIEINNWISKIEDKIPDTDEYGELEGSYAQNALISMTYFFQFCINKNDENLGYVIEKVLESIDLINYEKDENYQEAFVIREEIKICQSLLAQILIKGDIDEQVITKVREWSDQFNIRPQMV